ncbi:MAG: helix-turn-helix domain-containing protein [Inhella sp.]
MALGRPLAPPAGAPVQAAPGLAAQPPLPGAAPAAQPRAAQRTGQSILQVGLACGFTSGPHFSNAYKAAFGCTPREERARELAGLRGPAHP